MYLKLLNRRLRNNPVPDGSRLWKFFLPVPFQQSVIVYKNGDVWEKTSFTTDEISDSDVDTFIQGGTDFRCQDGSFVHGALVAQGYEFETVYEAGEYLPAYTEAY